jgi:DNA replication protein DnaC
MEHFSEVADRVLERIKDRKHQRESIKELVSSLLMIEDFKGAAHEARVATFNGFDDLEPELYRLFLKHAPEPERCETCCAVMPWQVNRGFDYWKDKCQPCAFNDMMQRKAANIERIMAEGGISERYRNASLDDFPPPFKKIPLDKGVFVHGGVGTGKTQFLAARYRAQVLSMEPKQYVPEGNNRTHSIWVDFEYRGPLSVGDFPIFISAPALLMSIKSTFNTKDGPTEKEIIERYTDVPILFIDDIGAEYCSEWAIGVMFLIIDKRYNKNLITNFSSNLNLEQLSQRLNDRITSRICEMCHVIEMTGADRRHSNIARAA